MESKGYIDTIIEEFFLGKVGSLNDWKVYSKNFPSFQFVDIYKSADNLARDNKKAVLKVISINSSKELSAILNGEFYDHESRNIQPAEMKSYKISLKE